MKNLLLLAFASLAFGTASAQTYPLELIVFYQRAASDFQLAALRCPEQDACYREHAAFNACMADQLAEGRIADCQAPSCALRPCELPIGMEPSALEAGTSMEPLTLHQPRIGK